eukprot:TRINITY_DN49770_c0_g1_i1.p1 TRINITY_DN49770_c0_g1~~TRINITY_DN49770_c0_g1_i1.p1  ORF type:complete len:322 (-),score=51.80 TRINITY_DN49770_c0_g1_i1:149-1066(-)
MVTLLKNRTILRAAGPEVFDFLQGLVTADTRLLVGESPRALLAGAFLSPKGRLLADCIFHRNADDCVLIDVHASVADKLLTLLRRHRMRRQLELDLDPTRKVVASLGYADGLHADPRFAGLGFRGVATQTSDDMVKVANETESTDDDWYLLQRVLMCVPEGPGDLGIDTTFPLHGNLDLFGTVSFTKGCYVGQELTTRSKFRGAIRRRFVTVSTTPPEAPSSSSSTSAQPLLVGAEDRNVHTAEGDKLTTIGTLHSISGSAGLCSLKFSEAANSPQALAQAIAKLPQMYAGDVKVFPSLPPYCVE